MNIHVKKEFLKKIIPLKIQALYKLYVTIKAYWYDIKRNVRVTLSDKYAVQRLKRDLSILYHRVEKGLTMPETKKGFGQKLIKELIEAINNYERKQYSTQSVEFVQAVSVIKEYIDYHEQMNFVFDSELTVKLGKIKQRYKHINGVKQIETTNTEYFKNSDKSFDEFTLSRHSVRNYISKEIPSLKLSECVTLAQSAPSFCNRQPSRVHIVKTDEKKRAVLNIQGGNRGFGHLADTLLVVTSVISTTLGPYDRYANHLNSGMFCMNLLNALHLKKIGTCSLNWSVSKEEDIKLRKVLNIEDNEIVIMIITCGYLPERFKLAASPRLNAEDIIYWHI